MPPPSPGPRSGPDACPGALRLHDAADGALARVRVPGGRLTGAQLATLAGLAGRLGDGHLELTSRANIQLRGLPGTAGTELAAALTDAGLLPSIAHERVRNIVASPLARSTVPAELDAALCADPALAALPGRFLFGCDDGSGDVLAMGADITALFLGGGYAVLLAGYDCGLRARPAGVAALMVAAARAFLAEAGSEWRLGELPGGPAVVARRLGSAVPPSPVHLPAPPSPIGPLFFADGTPARGYLVPLGRLGPAHLAALDGVADLVITPWRGIVVPGAVEIPGLIADPESPWSGVTACAGRPGCAKALADVRADAAASLAPGELPVHWIGCARGCGSPAGTFVRVLATPDGYELNGTPLSWDDLARELVAARRP